MSPGQVKVLEAPRRRDRATNTYDNPERARAYNASVLIRQDGIRRAGSMEVQPGWSILDIGTGPGTLAVPLAVRVRRITAVEPSSTMRNLLALRIAEEGVKNIRVVPAAWEEVYPGGVDRHDLVIASYSMLMDDWEGALAAMNRAARRRVDVYWFDGPTAWDRMYTELYPPVHGRPYTPGRKVGDMVEILAGMGIEPLVQPLAGTSFPATYPSMDDALADLRRRLDVSPGRHDDLFRTYARDHFVPLPGGGYLRRDETAYTLVSWRTDRS